MLYAPSHVVRDARLLLKKATTTRLQLQFSLPTLLPFTLLRTGQNCNFLNSGDSILTLRRLWALPSVASDDIDDRNPECLSGSQYHSGPRPPILTWVRILAHSPIMNWFVPCRHRSAPDPDASGPHRHLLMQCEYALNPRRSLTHGSQASRTVMMEGRNRIPLTR